LTDVLGGNAPNVKNVQDAAFYIGGKVLDGFGAVGSAQLGKSIGRALSGWFQRVTMEGSTRLVGTYAGSSMVELPTAVVEASKKEFGAAMGEGSCC